MRFQLFRKDEGDRSRLERGQAMVEVALLLPFVFILLLMVVELGFMMWSHLNVNASAREAARYAAVANIVGNDLTPTCGGTVGPPAVGTVKGRALEASLERLRCEDVAVSYFSANDTFIGRGDEVVVRIAHDYEGITPLVKMMASWGIAGPSGTITLRACADARLERSYPNQAEALALPALSCTS